MLIVSTYNLQIASISDALKKELFQIVYEVNSKLIKEI